MNHRLFISICIILCSIFLPFFSLSFAEESNKKLDIKITQITNDSAEQEAPSIWGDSIVWQERNTVDSNYEIFSYNIELKSKHQITHSSDDNNDPYIYGDNVIWWIYENNNGIPMYNLKTKEIKMIDMNATVAAPQIYKNNIVYGDGRNYPYLSIYVYNLSTDREILICSTLEVHNLDIDIWENLIVWVEYHNNQTDVYLFDLNTMKEKQITNTPENETEPRISGENIVWFNWDNGNCEIYNTKNNTIFNIIEGSMHLIYNEFVIVGFSNIPLHIYNISSGKEYSFPSPLNFGSGYDLYQNKLVYMKKSDIYLLEFTFTDNGGNGNNTNGTDDGKGHNSLTIPSATMSFLVMAIIIIAVVRRRRD